VPSSPCRTKQKAVNIVVAAMWYATDAQKMQGVEVGVDMGLEVWSWNGFWGECGWLLLLLGAAAADDSDDDFGGCHNKVAGAAASHKGRGSSCVACFEHEPH
jgi:hypothetical protein